MSEGLDQGYELDYMPVIDLVWGRGYIAPGGDDNVAKIVEGVDLSDRVVIDFGSGSGGGAVALAKNHGARVIGLELEPPLVERSREIAAEAGVADRVEFRCVEPGPLALEDQSIDVFYTSGVMIHVPDRDALLREVMRVLRPGGWLVGYDWFVERETEETLRWAEAAELHFHVANLALYHQLLESNGFESVSSHDATAWYKVQATNELEQMRGPLYQAAKELADEQVINNLILEWEALVDSIAIGALSQGYFRGRKPG